MATRPEQLYEEDFYAWTRDQARALRRLAATRLNVALDLEHLIKEVADLGKSERFAVRGQLRRIIEHCLKLAWSPVREPCPGWHETVIDARTILEDKLSPMLRRDLRRNLPHLYDSGATEHRRGATRLRRAQRSGPAARSDARTAWQTCCGTAGIPKTGTACAKPLKRLASTSHRRCGDAEPAHGRRSVSGCGALSPNDSLASWRAGDRSGTTPWS